MHNFKKLFVAIDFSPSSDEALRQAHDRATSTGAHLAVCHVVPNELRNNLLFPQDTRNAVLRFPLEMKKIGEAAVTRVREITGRTEQEFHLILDDGTPQALILSLAEEWRADLIIVGSQGQSSASDTLLGSVADSILRHAHSPVLVVRPEKKTRRIVAGTDFSDPALPALRAAATEAERTGSELIVVHSLDLVWSPMSYPIMAFGGSPFNVSPEEISKLNEAATQRLEESLKQIGVIGEAVVTTGAAGTAILQIAAEREAGLIVVGTVGRTGLRRALLGSVAETIVKQAACSVMVVRQNE
jgi:nucleotide-binding universal stress UspA family protein